MDFCPPFIARRLLGFDTVFKIDDKPDFLIFPQRFCFGNIHALDTLLYRFFRIGRAERLCAGKPFLSGSAKGNVFALFDFIPHFLQAAQQFVKITSFVHIISLSFPVTNSSHGLPGSAKTVR